jgi:cobalamin biosynthesis protein CobT
MPNALTRMLKRISSTVTVWGGRSRLHSNFKVVPDKIQTAKPVTFVAIGAGKDAWNIYKAINRVNASQSQVHLV